MRKIQLAIPMAGLGSRFATAGYKQLKPLIPIHGVPMISIVVANLMHSMVSDLVLIARRETVEAVDLRAATAMFQGNVTIVSVDDLTEGPAATVEAAYSVLDMKRPLVIANSDQYVDASLDGFYRDLTSGIYAGSVLCMRDNDPKWSYAALNDDGLLERIVEKQVISNLATVGIYGYSHAKLAFDSFERMRSVGDYTNGELYVGPGYNYIVGQAAGVSVFDLGDVSTVMHGLGIPDDLELFLKSPVSKFAASRAQGGSIASL